MRWALWSYLVNKVSASQRLNNLHSKIYEYHIWNLISVTSDFKVCILSALFSLTPHGANTLFIQKYDYESNIDLHFMWVFAEYTKGLNTNTLIVWKLSSLKYWLSNVALDSINALFKNTVFFLFLVVHSLELKSDCVYVPPHYKWPYVNHKAFWIAKDKISAEAI